MSDFLVNWVKESTRVRTFVTDKSGVLHVIGDGQSRATTFIGHVIDMIDSMQGGYKTCVVDPHYLGTASPVGALRTLARELDVLARAREQGAAGRVEFIKNIRSIFGDVRVDGNTLGANYSEEEEVTALISALQDEIDSGRNFEEVVIVFRELDGMDAAMRRRFYSTMWKPVIESMAEQGASVLFQFADDQLAGIDGAIPPQARMAVRLPQSFAEEVVEEIAQLAIDRGWEANRDAALGLARTVIRTSSTIEEAYAQMARLEESVA